MARSRATAVLFLIASVMLIGQAYAQEGVQPIIDFSPLFNDFIIPVVGSVLGGLTIWAVSRFLKKLGIDIEAKHRDSLQAAITNAASLAIQKVGDRAKIHVNSQTLADAANYVVRAAPDAMAKFGLSPKEIEEKVFAKLPQIQPVSPQETAEANAAAGVGLPLPPADSFPPIHPVDR